jgi:periplasmic copper chaperone A
MRGWWLVAAAATLPACGQRPDPLRVDQAWVRLPAVPGRPAAAYFTIRGGPAPATLISLHADAAIETQLHESMVNGMRPIAQVQVPANGAVAFQPGGRHAMLFDLNRGIVPGRTVTLTFTFADGTRLIRRAPAVAANAPAP